MNFDKFPEVDRYSENEDESNSYFRLHFSERNGFLPSRPEKDKGSDFIVELIHNRMSTNWRFPVQLKSIDDPHLIENETIISYSFDVSRLRYMLESIPPVGLIILYLPQKKTLYYDYAEAIYTRLLERRDGNLAWKSQEKVNIHIPVSNVVDSSSLTQIHQEILTRHQNSHDRSPALYLTTPHAIPASDTAQQEETATEAFELLKTKGLEMYYSNEIPALIKLVDQIQLKVLREDAHLALLAGITNWAVGKPVDATFFLEKALNNPSITAEDHAHAAWTKRYLDQYLGKISLKEYNKQIKALLLEVPTADEEQRLKYELCIARNEIDLLGPSDMVAIFDLPNQFKSFNHRISVANLSADVMVGYYLQNVTNLGGLLIKFDSMFRRKLTWDKKNGKDIDLLLIAEKDSLVLTLTQEVEHTFAHLKPLARNFVHDIRLSQCFESQVSIWLEMNLNALLYPLKKFDFHSADHKKNLALHTRFAKEALASFLAHHFYMNAYNMTLMLLELSEFATHSDLALDLDQAATHQQADWLQQTLEAGPRQLQTKKLIEAYYATSHSQL
jgi:hypothetical protein